MLNESLNHIKDFRSFIIEHKASSGTLVHIWSCGVLWRVRIQNVVMGGIPVMLCKVNYYLLFFFSRWRCSFIPETCSSRKWRSWGIVSVIWHGFQVFKVITLSLMSHCAWSHADATQVTCFSTEVDFVFVIKHTHRESCIDWVVLSGSFMTCNFRVAV